MSDVMRKPGVQGTWNIGRVTEGVVGCNWTAFFCPDKNSDLVPQKLGLFATCKADVAKYLAEQGFRPVSPGLKDCFEFSIRFEINELVFQQVETLLDWHEIGGYVEISDNCRYEASTQIYKITVTGDKSQIERVTHFAQDLAENWPGVEVSVTQIPVKFEVFKAIVD